MEAWFDLMFLIMERRMPNWRSTLPEKRIQSKTHLFHTISPIFNCCNLPFYFFFGPHYCYHVIFYWWLGLYFFWKVKWEQKKFPSTKLQPYYCARILKWGRRRPWHLSSSMTYKKILIDKSSLMYNKHLHPVIK